VIKGEIQMAYVIGSAVEPIDTSLELLKLPFLFPDVDTLYKCWTDPGQRLFSKLKEKGVIVTSLASSGMW